jgi:hypothetical protein
MSIFTNSSSSTPDEIAGYVEAILGLLGDRNPREVLGDTPRLLRAELDGVGEAQASIREAPGKWSLRHVVQHLADSDVVFGWRMRMILAHERPAIAGYDQDLWADNLGYGSVPIADSLADFTALRGANLRLIDRTPRDTLDRVGVHAERGEESVAHLLRLYAGHDLLHLRQIARIKAGL